MATLTSREALVVFVLFLLAIAGYVVFYVLYVHGAAHADKNAHGRIFILAVFAGLLLVCAVSTAARHWVMRDAHRHYREDGRTVYIFPISSYEYCDCGGGFETARWGITDADGGMRELNRERNRGRGGKEDGGVGVNDSGGGGDDGGGDDGGDYGGDGGGD